MFRSTKFFFFFNDTATTEIYTLSLHDALPICDPPRVPLLAVLDEDPHELGLGQPIHELRRSLDRKSTRLNSSHSQISYAVFCLKKKNNVPDQYMHHAYARSHNHRYGSMSRVRI